MTPDEAVAAARALYPHAKRVEAFDPVSPAQARRKGITDPAAVRAVVNVYGAYPGERTQNVCAYADTLERAVARLREMKGTP